MLLASKTAWAALVFLLLAAGISGPPRTPFASAANLIEEVPAAAHRNDVMKMQQTLWDKGHYRGEVDGVLGLRTRTSIRGFQKAENLPVTGKLDAKTAGKLGVAPEGLKESVYETTKDKPSAGVKWTGRTGKSVRKAAKSVAVPRGQAERTKPLQAEAGKSDSGSR
jgi:peptidoglycan hydrolase-like protein with peptidoglycan-binding domain